MTPHPQADLPAIQRYKIGYHSDDWGQRSSTPSGIPDASGSWVRYADHVAALVDGQAVAPAKPDPTPGDHPPPCDSELFESGVSVGLFDIPKWTAEALCKGIAAATGARIDWHYIGGRVHVKALPAPPAMDASPSAASTAWSALRDLTDPLGEAGTKIMGHVRIYAQRQYEAGRTSHGQAPAVKREFTNELGNSIRITVEGPNSMHENIVTPMEAKQLREALNEHAQKSAPAGADLGTLNGLAKQYADSYASPHHFTLGVNGLRQIIQRALPQAAQQAPAGAWIERWYGSGSKEGYEGWSIVSKEGRSLVAYLGRGVEPGAVTEIVMAHNAAPAAPSTPTSGGWISVERHSDQSVLVVFPSCRLASEFERSLLPASPTIGGESNG